MTDQSTPQKTVFTVTGRIVGRLNEIRKESAGKAALANLRNSIGRPVSETIAVWPIIFEQMPEQFLGKYGSLTSEEEAILTTLQLYALHQQGLDHSVSKKSEKGQWDNLGISLKVLRLGDDTAAMDRRFNTMITATTFEELSHHLRQMIKLLKSKQRSETINYAQLANDLYWYLRGSDESVRLSWAKAYYSRRQGTEKGEENND